MSQHETERPILGAVLREFLRRACEDARKAGLSDEYALQSFGRGYLNSQAPRLIVINRGLQFARPRVAELLGVIPTVVFVDQDGVGIAAPAPLEGFTRNWAKQQQAMFFGEIEIATGRTVVYE